MKKKAKKITCSDCEGWGYWEYPTTSRIAKVPCQKCKGTGKTKKKERKE